jgi:hypothetical protein
MSGSAVVGIVGMPPNRAITIGGALTPPQGTTYSATITPDAYPTGTASWQVLTESGGSYLSGSYLSDNYSKFRMSNTSYAILSNGYIFGSGAVAALGAIGYTTLSAAINIVPTLGTATITVLGENININSGEADLIKAKLSGKTITLTVPAGQTKTIKRSASGFGGLFTGSLFMVGATESLTLAGNGSNELVIDGGSASDYSANEPLITVNGTLNISNGAIIRNNAGADYGGGVKCEPNGIINMSGGEISGNSATDRGGGILNNHTFNMYGGTISGNTAGSDGGGGVSTEPHNTVNVDAKFTMYNGEISGNSATKAGGVYVYKNDEQTLTAIFTMRGGTIYGMDATDPSKKNTTTMPGNGAALYVDDNVTADYSNGDPILAPTVHVGDNTLYGH